MLGSEEGANTAAAKEVMGICLYSQGCGPHLSAFIAHEGSEEQTFRELGSKYS